MIRFSQNILEGHQAAGDDARHRLGHPDPAGRLARRSRPSGFYVWFDAVIGYLSASIEWARRTGDPDAWREWWNDPEALSYYFMGKDNITFHSQIWPAELLAYDGRGARGGEPGPFGELQLPTEVVSSEFLTMEGRQFSTSRSVVIYVRDMLARYQADALRYFICAAGPETKDATSPGPSSSRAPTVSWSQAGATSSTGRRRWSPGPSARSQRPVSSPPTTRRCWRRSRDGFDTVGGLLGGTVSGRRIAEAMRVVGEVNKYVTDQEPYKLKAPAERERLATILHVTSQAVDGLQPHAGPRSCRTPPTGCTRPRRHGDVVADAADRGGRRPGRRSGLPDHHRRLLRCAAMGRRPIGPGTPIGQATPIFPKLDPAVVDDELARLAPERRRVTPRSAPAAAPNRCRCRSSTTTAISTSVATTGRSRRRRSALAAAVGVTPHRPDRLRPPGRRVGGRHGRAVRRHRGRRRAAPERGAPDSSAARATSRQRLAEIERAGRQRPGCAPSARPGLDYFRTGPDGRDGPAGARSAAHIELAKRLGLALVIHDRDAHDDVLRILDEEEPPERTVLHCFSGDAAIAPASALDRGYYLSFAGTVTFKNAQALRDGAAGHAAGPGAGGDRRAVPHADCRIAAGRTRLPRARTRCASWPRCSRRPGGPCARGAGWPTPSRLRRAGPSAKRDVSEALSRHESAYRIATGLYPDFAICRLLAWSGTCAPEVGRSSAPFPNGGRQPCEPGSQRTFGAPCQRRSSLASCPAV